MHQIVYIRSEELFPLINDMIRHDKNVRMAVTGTSMYPFLREGIDSVELVKADFSKIRCADIAVIQRDNGQFIMHRVIKKYASCFFIIGDAQQWIEGPVYPDQLVAAVTAVWRKDKRIDVKCPWWVLPSRLWLRLVPLRHIIIRGFRFLRCLFGHSRLRVRMLLVRRSCFEKKA